MKPMSEMPLKVQRPLTDVPQAYELNNVCFTVKEFLNMNIKKFGVIIFTNRRQYQSSRR